MEQAILITPQGERITLSPEVYEKVRQLIVIEHPAPQMTKEELEQVIKETMGSLKGGRSLTQALLESRREERALEMKRERARRKRRAALAKRAA